MCDMRSSGLVIGGLGIGYRHPANPIQSRIRNRRLMQLHGLEAALFYVLAIMTLFMAVFVVTARVAVHSALFLISTLVNVASAVHPAARGVRSRSSDTRIRRRRDGVVFVRDHAGADSRRRRIASAAVHRTNLAGGDHRIAACGVVLLCDESGAGGVQATRGTFGDALPKAPSERARAPGRTFPRTLRQLASSFIARPRCLLK